MWNLKKSSVLLCIILLIIVFSTGCIKMGFTIDNKVNKDANIAHQKMSISTDSAGYSLLKSSAKDKGYSSIKELMENNSAGITKSLEKENVIYSENWDKERSTFTMTFEKNVPFSPSADSKINIQKIDKTMIYRDESFYNPSTQSAPSSGSNSFFTQEQSENMVKMMLSGITLDYYLEMPGKILESNADTITDNKAEWHVTGADISNTKIYAKSEVPLLSGFTSFIAVITIVCLIGYFGKIRKND
jgi:hypothetical protein